MTRHRPAILRAAALGTGIGALVATLAALRDWWLNPAGLFHGPAGTDWSIVFDTWWSWFLPVAAPVVAVLVPVAWLLGRRRLARAAPPPDTGDPVQRGDKDG